MCFFIVFLQVENNYQAQVRIFKDFHKNVIGKGGSNIKKVSIDSFTEALLLFIIMISKEIWLLFVDKIIFWGFNYPIVIFTWLFRLVKTSVSHICLILLNNSYNKII